MKKVKKISSLILALMMSMCSMSVNAAVMKDFNGVVVTGEKAADYTFSYGNKTYQLLDYTDVGGNPRFYVFQNNHCNYQKFANVNTGYFNPAVSEDNNIGYISNQTSFLSYIDDDVEKEIAEHTWTTEEYEKGGGEYSFTAKIGTLSATEVKEYKDKLKKPLITHGQEL